MRRGVTLALVLSLPACGAPFTVAPASNPPPSDDAGDVSEPIKLPLEASAPDARDAADVGPEADPPNPPDAGPDANPAPDAPAPDASPARDTGPDAPPEASLPDAPPALLLPFRCVSPSTGYVACDSGGGWTVRFDGTQTCDVSHPALVGCVRGSPCEFFQTGATPIEGTCQP